MPALGSRGKHYLIFPDLSTNIYFAMKRIFLFSMSECSNTFIRVLSRTQSKPVCHSQISRKKKRPFKLYPGFSYLKPIHHQIQDQIQDFSITSELFPFVSHINHSSPYTIPQVHSYTALIHPAFISVLCLLRQQEIFCGEGFIFHFLFFLLVFLLCGQIISHKIPLKLVLKYDQLVG